MKVLNIIDKIYENSHFSTFLVYAIIGLVVLFILVLILGIRDSKKSKEIKVEKEEDVKDITFSLTEELDNIKEDVTFEMPSLTQNLENFKRSLEAEIQKEDIAEVRKTSGLILPKVAKQTKILDLEKIEDTSILPLQENTINQKNTKDVVSSSKADMIEGVLPIEKEIPLIKKETSVVKKEEPFVKKEILSGKDTRMNRFSFLSRKSNKKNEVVLNEESSTDVLSMREGQVKTREMRNQLKFPLNAKRENKGSGMYNMEDDF